MAVRRWVTHCTVAVVTIEEVVVADATAADGGGAHEADDIEGDNGRSVAVDSSSP